MELRDLIGMLRAKFIKVKAYACERMWQPPIGMFPAADFGGEPETLYYHTVRYFAFLHCFTFLHLHTNDLAMLCCLAMQ